MYSESRRFRCRSLRAITWSSSSRRQLPTQRSAIPFCQGLSNEVRTAFIFRDRMAAGTSVPYFASRSWIRISEPRQKEMPPATAGRMLRDVEVQGYGGYHG